MLEFVRIRPEGIASCFFALAKCRVICSGWVVLSPTICVLAVAQLTYMGVIIADTFITRGGAARVGMVGSAEPTASRWSVRPTRPSCRGRFGRSDHLDFVGLVGPSVPTSSTPPMRP